ncbi:hypothetical protein CLOM_g4134 [Closterium sp. NIES-68]|nr:hypothetical protein CLOM_g4134 [Closterium sp. NIES-68]GJP62908.1 hypothetical protein CLOP_g19974 [Closterium sp. NIES-67]GJP83636.1 hypothetical protein CLOP_g13763 [Closterium sp. NIES-67]GJP86157.1 hypothetical protein CLOP_g16217 [Closterium sp. NIES-67]
MGSSAKAFPIALRFLECCFCSATFAILCYLNFSWRSINVTAFLFGTGVTGLILSFIHMLVHVAAVAGVKMDSLGSQLFCSFMMMMLLFAASCASASFTSRMCNSYSSSFLLGFVQDSCTLLKWSNAMGFLGTITYMTSFWVFTSFIYMEA